MRSAPRSVEPLEVTNPDRPLATHDRSSSDVASGVLPIALADTALEYLAGLLAREAVVEHHDLRNLEAGQPRADMVAHRRFGQSGVRLDVDVGRECLAELVVGDAEDGDVADAVELEQTGLDLRGIDVRPAGDDHVARAVGKVEKSVLVHLADIYDRDVAVAIDFAATVLLVQVGEAGPVTGRPDVHLAGLARREQLAGGVEHVDVSAAERPTDGSLVGEPLVAVASDHDPDLRRPVVLEDDRSEPLDHAPLDVDGARGGGVYDALERAEVVAGADVVGEIEQPHEHRRDDLRVRDPLRFD